MASSASLIGLRNVLPAARAIFAGTRLLDVIAMAGKN
jgi:hypothetical protein